MHSKHTILSRLVPAFALLTGCTADLEGDSSTSIAAPDAQGTAQLALTAEGSTPALLKVQAYDEASGQLGASQDVSFSGESATLVSLQLVPKTYVFKIDAYDDAQGSQLTGTAKVKVKLEAGLVTQVKVKLHLQAKPSSSGGSGGSTAQAQASASVAVQINHAPSVSGVQVQIPATLSATADGKVQVQVQAKDPEGSSLKFYWSGLGIQGSVAGSASIAVSAKAIVEAKGNAHLFAVIQDDDGAATALKIHLLSSGGLPSSQADAQLLGTGATASAAADACLDAHAECEVKCDAQADAAATPTSAVAQAQAACQGQCGASLAGCVAASVK